MPNERYNARRRLEERRPNSIVVIVCDDTDTAPAYFRSLFPRECDGKRFQIVEAPHGGATASAVIEAAKSELARLSPDDGDRVWALIDLEMAPNSDHLAQQCQSQATAAEIGIALSQPCFEIWILSHFESNGQHFQRGLGSRRTA